MNGIQNLGIAVNYAGKEGRGVFATKDFSEGDTIECCPVLPIFIDTEDEDEDCEITDEDDQLRFEWNSTNLTNYVYDFSWYQVIALGYGSLYNHSDDPNVDYDTYEEANMIVMSAARDIKAGEQLFIAYDNPEEYDISFEGNKYNKEEQDDG